MQTSSSTGGETGPLGRQDPALPQVFGRYLLIQRLSRGGMGEIFIAKHGLAGFEKLAVIKKVLPHLAADASFISRFVDEAQVAIKLQHVNVAQVFEVGRVGDEYFLALEYVEGRDLRRTLGLLNQNRRRMPVDLALFVGREMANGLAYAHRRTGADGKLINLVHCDISPPNVLVSFEGETKVIDFGIAKSAIRGTATDPKMGFGKFGYMAPEQLIRGGVVDHRTDIYAAGVVLYELLTGKRLYEAGPEPDYRALARKVARGEHDLPSESDKALAPYDDLVATALRPKVEDRYQSAAEFRDAIQQCLVSVNPTISTDQLGAFMRELFAEEMAAQKELHDRVANAHLSDFEAALQTQAISTVSFAVGAVPLDTTNIGPAPAPPPHRAVTPIPGSNPVMRRPASKTNAPPLPSSSTPLPASPVSPALDTVAAPTESIDVAAALADGTGTVDKLKQEPARARDRRRTLVIALGAGAVVFVATLAFAFTRGGGDEPARPVAKLDDGSAKLTVVPIDDPKQPDPAGSAAAATAGSGSAAAPGVDPTPPAKQDPEPPKADPEIEIKNDPAPKRPGGTKRHPDHPPKQTATPPATGSAASAPKAGISHADVVAKFGAVAREYTAYKKANGLQLDGEWADLMSFVTYHKGDDDETSRRIDAFRAKLK